MLELRNRKNILEQRRGEKWSLFSILSGEIRAFRVVHKGNIIVLTSPTEGAALNERNVYLLNNKGFILWQIEKPSTCCGGYKTFTFRNNILSVTATDSIEYMVNFQNGRILGSFN